MSKSKLVLMVFGVLLILSIRSQGVVIVSGDTLNGNFNNLINFNTNDEQPYSNTVAWQNIGTGSQGSQATRSNLTYDGSRNLVICGGDSRITGLDTGFIIQSGNMFNISYVWRDAWDWNDSVDQVKVTLFVTDDDTIGGTRSNLVVDLSGLSTQDNTFEQVIHNAIYTVNTNYDGKRLFIEIHTTATGTSFGRLDNFELTVDQWQVPDPEIDLDQARARLAVIRDRIDEHRMKVTATAVRQGHPLVSYLDESANIIERLIGYIEKDIYTPGEFYYQHALIQGAECEQLLDSLEDELDAIDSRMQASVFTADRTFNVKDFGAIGDGVTRDRELFVSAMNAVKSAGPGAKLFVPAGTYLIYGHLVFNDFNNVNIEGEEGTIIMQNIVAPILTINYCNNITYKNLVLDHLNEKLPWSQGTITAVDTENHTIEIELAAGYPDPTQSYFLDSERLRGTQNDPVTGEPDESVGDPKVSDVVSLSGNFYRLTMADNSLNPLPISNMQNFKPGHKFVLHARGAPGSGPALNVNFCKNITFENVKVYASFGHVVINRGSESTKFRGFVAERKPSTDRLTCANADGFHMQHSRKGALIENCRVMWQNDDDINFYSLLREVLDCQNDTEFIVSTPESQWWWSRIGDAVCFSDKSNGELIGFARITQITFVEYQGISYTQLTLDRVVNEAIRNNPTNYKICVINAKCDGSIVRSSQFGIHRANGSRLKNANAVIEGCEFNKTNGTTFHPTEGGGEGFIARNYYLCKNASYNNSGFSIIYDLLSGTSGPDSRVHRRIFIEDNMFEDAYSKGIDFYYVRDSHIIGNYICSRYPITIDNCSDILISDNFLKMGWGSSTSNAIRIFNSDTDTITVENNVILEE